jgi:hypothetical protein
MVSPDTDGERTHCPWDKAADHTEGHPTTESLHELTHCGCGIKERSLLLHHDHTGAHTEESPDTDGEAE